jgi:hypothetical protein
VEKGENREDNCVEVGENRRMTEWKRERTGRITVWK